MSNYSHSALRLQNVIFTVLLLTIIGLLGWLGKSYHRSFDITADQRNSLHQSTRELLQRIDKPINLVAYVPDDAVVHTNLKQLIEKYQKHKADITLEFVNPDLDPVRAKQDGIDFSGQLLIRIGENSNKVSSVDEQTMLNALQRLSRDEPRLVIFLEGHDERSPLLDNSNGLSQLAGVLEKNGFRLQPHNLLRTQSIPDNASFVVIAAPQKAYLEGEVKIIEDYLSQGGNLLWLHEPGELQGLDSLETQFGLELHQGTMLDANQALQEMLGIRHPAAIAIIDYGPSELTRDLAAHTLFPFATAIIRDEESSATDNDNSWHYQPILTTLPTSWLESGEIQGNVKFDDEDDKPGPLDLGMLLTRDNATTATDAVNDSNKPQQRVVVIGDSDFLQNTYIGQGSNLELANNLFNWLSADDDLLSITPKVAPGTTLVLSSAGRIGLALLWIGLPLVLLLFGTLRWLRRRKR